MRNFITTGQAKILGLTTHQLAMHKDKYMVPMNLTSECWASDMLGTAAAWVCGCCDVPAMVNDGLWNMQSAS